MMTDSASIHVECYAGYRGDETPRRIRFAERTVELVDVVDRWLSPEHRYFKCRGADNAIYILRHDVKAERWELTFFDRSRPVGGSDLNAPAKT